VAVLIIGCADCIFRIIDIFYEPLLLLIIIICFNVNYQMRSRYISLHLWTRSTELYRHNVQWRIYTWHFIIISTSRQFSLKYETHLFFEYFECCVLVEPPIVPHFLKKDIYENNNIMVAFPTKNDDYIQVSFVVFTRYFTMDTMGWIYWYYFILFLKMVVRKWFFL